MLIGSAREQLLSYSQRDLPSLVVIASHGRAGLPRAIIGSVADGLLRGPAPVLLLRPDETDDWMTSR